MIKKIKNYLISLLVVFSVSLPVTAPLTVFAATPCPGGASVQNNSIVNNINSGVNAATGQTPGAGTGCTLNQGIGKIASTVINLFSLVVGVVSVVFIIYAGFRYVTSGGSSENVSGAKNTLIYAIVGLVIVAIAQLIVHYVLNSAATVGS
jgi:hypothetical protein